MLNVSMMTINSKAIQLFIGMLMLLRDGCFKPCESRIFQQETIDAHGNALISLCDRNIECLKLLDCDNMSWKQIIQEFWRTALVFAGAPQFAPEASFYLYQVYDMYCEEKVEGVNCIDNTMFALVFFAANSGLEFSLPIMPSCDIIDDEQHGEWGLATHAEQLQGIARLVLYMASCYSCGSNQTREAVKEMAQTVYDSLT